jgi:hypothetical protein
MWRFTCCSDSFIYLKNLKTLTLKTAILNGIVSKDENLYCNWQDFVYTRHGLERFVSSNVAMRG